MTDIIWDWNGTLLNDLHYCIDTINILLGKRNLPLLDHNRYREVFSFPVKEYYRQIGFDFNTEDFEGPAAEFTDLYRSKVKACPLHDEAKNVLHFFKQKRVRQFVLSAMEQEMLELTLRQKGIYNFFYGIAGLDDHYAVSKIDTGYQLLNEYQILPGNALMIGDTTHDFEVAKALGVRCVLISDGHQSEKRLRETGAPVLNSLGDLTKEKMLEVLGFIE